MTDTATTTKDLLYRLTTLDGNTVADETATGLVGQVIDGYGDIPDTDEGHDEALIVRYEFLRALGNNLQQDYQKQGVEKGALDVSGLHEDEIDALFSDRETAFRGVDRGDGKVDRDWKHDVPLVLIATDYVPHTKRPAPTGRIVWLDPLTEVTFLKSLETAGIARFDTAA